VQIILTPQMWALESACDVVLIHVLGMAVLLQDVIAQGRRSQEDDKDSISE